ncbi:glycosyltransferase family 4 protein [Bacillus sp. RG28]|uniref:Glycosyltransferase family 4 protein n=1 Tax=Gottfriedia endophytica TaxID=2820819 RepID=A0A940NM77_9BACI|nr:glycosyltransferase family 4 protein [Gottfriedia endophytica]MBP0725121.1 glycosyltransferase family 4 protein [Gottfriedia endophytica]
MKVNIVGPLPPPVGGISVHIKRVKKQLISKGVECNIYNEANVENEAENVYPIHSYKLFVLKIPFLKADVFHFHSISLKMRILLGVYKLLGKKIILTVHGESLADQINNSNRLVKFFLLKGLRYIDQVICVNEKNTKQLIDLGFNAAKLKTLPAFIKPFEDKQDIEAIPNFVWDFINNSEFVITANGCIRFYKDEDLYGVDLLVELVNRLLKNSIKVSLIFVVLDRDSQNEKERMYYKQIKEKIKDNKLESNFLFYETKDTEFYPILSRSHLFIRPTKSDGYGVSIAEAIHYNIPSIASDVCTRPEQTILFKSGDLNDLYNTTASVIHNYEKYKRKLETYESTDYFQELYDTYKSISGK